MTAASGSRNGSGSKRSANDDDAASSGAASSSKRPRQGEPSRPSTDPKAAASSSSASATQPPSRAPKPVTSVYVSNLPLDVTQEEIATVFSRYGVLLEDDTGSTANRIKLYKDPATGVFTGDALITYFKPESVELAVNLLDESCLRAHLGQREPVMRVKRAEFSKDKSKDKDDGTSSSTHHNKQAAPKPTAAGQKLGASSATQTQPDPKDKPAGEPQGESGGRRQLTDSEKRKVQKRMAKLQSKLDGWESHSDEEGPGPGIINSTTTSTGAPGQITGASGDLSEADPALLSSRTVILTKMFTLAELDEDPTLLLDLKEDVREECDTLGQVTNVVLYDKEPEGIMSVKFANVTDARACVAKMNNRFFAGRTISAFLSRGKPRYRRTGVRGPDDDDEEEAGDAEAKRIDSFGAWLEGGGDAAS
ncbi:hypothetical protein OC861_002212 [Tilletia horrida]|nr:hypothetical protein OC845_002046 [Tilletia horrida]KAK0568193.1 hypothetical protein OC861_002212 [Tilletia horrida]